MTEKIIKISAEDGYNLSATLREPELKSKGFIQIHCGTGIPQVLYANFAKYLTSNGYTTLTFDYRGIGASKPKSLKGFEAYIREWGQKDMTGVFNWALNNYPNDKKIIIAHSMGGQMVGLMENNNKIDQLYLIASSTGYWKDMSKPYKWILPPLWFVYIPLSIYIYGYVNAEIIKQGENLPKGVAEEWKKWCANPSYFEIEFGKSLHPLYYDQINSPIKSIQIADDPIANGITCNKLLKYYKNSEITIDKISPEEMGVSKIGHTGFFSRKFKDTLWRRLLNDINMI